MFEFMFGMTLSYTWARFAGLPNCCAALGSFCVFITGCVFRFSAEGAAISGDNAVEGVANPTSVMESSGTLMLVLVCLTFAAIGCCCCMLLAVFTVFAAHKDTLMAMAKTAMAGGANMNAMGGGAGGMGG